MNYVKCLYFFFLLNITVNLFPHFHFLLNKIINLPVYSHQYQLSVEITPLSVHSFIILAVKVKLNDKQTIAFHAKQKNQVSFFNQSSSQAKNLVILKSMLRDLK